jgi:hypothetical protein
MTIRQEITIVQWYAVRGTVSLKQDGHFTAARTPFFSTSEGSMRMMR